MKNKNLEMKWTVENIVSMSTIVSPKRKINIIKEDPDYNSANAVVQ